MQLLKILLVDDEEEFVTTLRERLRMRGLNTVVAFNGHQALEIVEQVGPEIVVLDLNMPDLDGFEVMRRIKKNHPATQVIILSGHGSSQDEAMAKLMGAFKYLQKPTNLDLLVQTIRQAGLNGGHLSISNEEK
jgi:DNA-binding response OmpR family regulator